MVRLQGVEVRAEEQGRELDSLRRESKVQTEALRAEVQAAEAGKVRAVGCRFGVARLERGRRCGLA